MQESKTQDLFDIWKSNCLKGVAVIILLFHHCFLSPKRYTGHELKMLFLPERFLNIAAAYGKICVALFVFVSAYGLTKKMMSLEAKGEISYFEGAGKVISIRLVKLLGNFIYYFLFITAACAILRPGLLTDCYSKTFPDNVEYFILDMLGIAHYLDTPSLIGTFWYYGLAIFLVLVLPLLYWLLVRMQPFMFMVLMIVINFFVSFANKDIWHYFLCIGVGMVCAYTNFITRGIEYKFVRSEMKNKIIKFVLGIFCILLSVIIREGPLKGTLYPVWDAVIPVLIVLFCCEFLFTVPVLGNVFHYLGIYSAGIFLIHNFIRSRWFYDYTYSFRYPALIVLMLLIESLIVAIILEKLKKLLHYNKLLDRIAGR